MSTLLIFGYFVGVPCFGLAALLTGGETGASGARWISVVLIALLWPLMVLAVVVWLARDEYEAWLERRTRESR